MRRTAEVQNLQNMKSFLQNRPTDVLCKIRLILPPAMGVQRFRLLKLK